MMNQVFKTALTITFLGLLTDDASAGICRVCNKPHAVVPVIGKKVVGMKMVPKSEAKVMILKKESPYGAEHVPFTIQGMKDGWYDIGTNGYIWPDYLIKLEDGVAYYTKYIEDHKHLGDPKPVVWARQMRATCWIATGDYPLAVAECELLLGLNANDAVAFLLRGIAYDKLKQADKAKADFDQALVLRPEYCAAYKHRGMWWMAKSDHGKAAEDFMNAVKHNPKSASAHRYLGEAQFHLKKYDDALKSFESANALIPYASAYEWQGKIWELKKDYAKAVEAYAKAHELDPKLSRAASRLVLLKNLGPHTTDKNESVAEATADCVQTGWKDIPALHNLIKACVDAGDFRMAEWATQKILELLPAEPLDRSKLVAEQADYKKKADAAGQ